MAERHTNLLLFALFFLLIVSMHISSCACAQMLEVDFIELNLRLLLDLIVLLLV